MELAGGLAMPPAAKDTPILFIPGQQFVLPLEFTLMSSHMA